MMIISNVVYVQIVKISNCSLVMCIKSVWNVIKILLITWSKHREVCFNLAVFCNISLLHDNVVTFYTYEVLGMSRVTVWLIGLN
jgi:hypothetical protein